MPVSLTYGLTETASQVTTLPVAALADPAHTAGPPLFCTRLRIAADGEILLAGPTVARSACTRDGWLETGDLGRVDERGWLQVLGRKADTIVTGGENVAPAEVEAVLEAHPAVIEAAVVGRPHEEWGEMVAAWIVAELGDLRWTGTTFSRTAARTSRPTRSPSSSTVPASRCRGPRRAS